MSARKGREALLPEPYSKTHDALSDSEAPSYLYHLDGLRAIALLGVLAFHFRVKLCMGGYIGVDVFFVLSGFLMSRNISSAIAQRRFKLGKFYFSRLMRLFPAALFTILFSLLFAFLVFNPQVSLKACESAAAAFLGSSNLYFFTTSGYWDTDSNLKPLLHTWSLSLEEQFYLFWPSLLLLLANQIRARRWGFLGGLCTVMCLGSLTYTGLRGESRSESSDFFLLPARLFEFGAGGLAHAIMEQKDIRPNRKKWFTGLTGLLIACAGLFSIAYSYTAFLPGSPVYFGALPVLGTMMVILTPSAKVNNILLANAPARWIGKKAYSVYLVHWPIYVFSSYISRALSFDMYKEYQRSWLAFLFISSFLLGSVLFHGVESRFRLKKASSPSRSQSSGIYHVVVIAMITAAFSVSGTYTHGWKFRQADDKRALDGFMGGQCRHVALSDRLRLDIGNSTYFCVVGNHRYSLIPLKITDFNIVVVGNSFAHSIVAAYKQIKQGPDEVPILFNYKPGCPVFPPGFKHGVTPQCQRAHVDYHNLFRHLRKNTTIVLTNNWGAYEQGENITDPYEVAAAVATAVKEAGLRPLLFGGPGGVANWHKVSACLDMSSSLATWGFGSKAAAAMCQKDARPRPDALRGELAIKKAIAEGKESFQYISSMDIFCTKLQTEAQYFCPATWERNGVTTKMYNDGKHLNFFGSALHSVQVQKMLEIVKNNS